MTNRFQRVPASSIKVERRVREDLGDLNSLAENIVEVGLLNPITVRPVGDHYVLVAGMRRYLAVVEHLGWSEVPVHVLPTLEDERKAFRAEMAENSQRLALSPYESVLKGAEIEPLERAAAEERRRTTQVGTVRVTHPDGNSHEGRVLDHVAASVGMSRQTYVRAKEIVRAAEADRLYHVQSHAGNSRQDCAGTGRHTNAESERDGRNVRL